MATTLNSSAARSGASRAPMPISFAPDSLPPFPAVALKALKVLSGTESSLRELCDLIRNDAAFSAEILRVANSPLIAFSKQITNILQASMLLGFQRLRSLVITVGLREYMKESVSDAMERCWRHSLACALLAERTARAVAVDKEFVYTGGILHDIGRVALATALPDGYARLLAKSAQWPQDLLASERELFGMDHCEVGRSLVTDWELPRAFFDVVACHHESFAQVDNAKSLIQFSCALADALGFAVARNGQIAKYEDLVAKLPERARKDFPSDSRELAQAIAKDINAIQWG
jgi:putative nucleotidyltransferase with HDIG domain